MFLSELIVTNSNLIIVNTNIRKRKSVIKEKICFGRGSPKEDAMEQEHCVGARCIARQSRGTYGLGAAQPFPG